MTEDVTNQRVYLYCEECEYGWLSPEEAGDVAKGFLTLEESFETENPSLEKIKQYDWAAVAKYVENKSVPF